MNKLKPSDPAQSITVIIYGIFVANIAEEYGSSISLKGSKYFSLHFTNISINVIKSSSVLNLEANTTKINTSFIEDIIGETLLIKSVIGYKAQYNDNNGKSHKKLSQQ